MPYEYGLNRRTYAQAYRSSSHSQLSQPGEYCCSMFLYFSSNKFVLFVCLQSHEAQWLECAQKLTQMIQQIIEFAKMVPGFMKLSQDDQIVLLKAGTLIFVFC